ncbi:hypothetical protein ACE1TF_07395 [Geomicrobium sp. JSM 1781026]|uniref:hypothetical protein n=1 Tax=Geomicrobium sp. JSM 1781026 TaxID=3344580 RepID=UPI0035C16C5B
MSSSLLLIGCTDVAENSEEQESPDIELGDALSEASSTSLNIDSYRLHYEITLSTSETEYGEEFLQRDDHGVLLNRKEYQTGESNVTEYSAYDGEQAFYYEEGSDVAYTNTIVEPDSLRGEIPYIGHTLSGVTEDEVSVFQTDEYDEKEVYYLLIEGPRSSETELWLDVDHLLPVKMVQDSDHYTFTIHVVQLDTHVDFDDPSFFSLEDVLPSDVTLEEQDGDDILEEVSEDDA